jgi:hypothetical protein
LIANEWVLTLSTFLSADWLCLADRWLAVPDVSDLNKHKTREEELIQR